MNAKNSENAMSDAPASSANENEFDVEQFIAARREAGRHINPKTAVVVMMYGDVGDPYGIYNLSEDCTCYGRSYYARSIGSNELVDFGDLPDETRNALWDQIRRKRELTPEERENVDECKRLLDSAENGGTVAGWDVVQPLLKETWEALTRRGAPPRRPSITHRGLPDDDFPF